MEPTVYTKSLCLFLTAICLICSIIVVVHCRRNRARDLLAWTLLLRVAVNLYRIYWLDAVTGGQGMALHVPTLLSGHFFALLMIFFPIEIIRPGWLDTRRVIRIAWPFLTLIALFFLGTYLSGLPIRVLHSSQEILRHLGEFNVWFRFVFYLSFFSYIGYMLTIVYIEQPRYHRWLSEHYASPEGMDIDWLNHYGIGYALLVLSFLLVSINGAPWHSLSHLLMMNVFYLFLSYRIITQRLPEAEKMKPYYKPEPVSSDLAHSRLFHYKVTIDEWMRRERPFLDAGFRIEDALKVVDVSAAELPHLFNLAYGESFATVIGKLRVTYSLSLLSDETLPIGVVARTCGFLSETSFIRTFIRYEGITPAAYRNKYLGKKK